MVDFSFIRLDNDIDHTTKIHQQRNKSKEIAPIRTIIPSTEDENCQ